MSDDDRYRCAVCEKLRVVPSLARDCEDRHEAEKPDHDHARVPDTPS